MDGAFSCAGSIEIDAEQGTVGVELLNIIVLFFNNLLIL
jgi:hypothetical protein